DGRLHMACARALVRHRLARAARGSGSDPLGTNLTPSCAARSRTVGSVLDLLLPRRCVVCARPGAQLCPACWGALRRVEPPLCERCGAPTIWPVARCRECTGRRLGFASARAALV